MSRKSGYGSFWLNGRNGYAHRISYELFKGSFTPNLTIDHLCRVRSCVNPDHLEAVTNRENILRGNTLPGSNARKTHCHLGHEFTPENTLWTGKRKMRQCRTCNRRRSLERYHRLKAQRSS